MAKCKCCGKEIQSVQVNFFNREGDDAWVLCGFTEYAPNAIELDVDQNWTGYELDEEEQRGTIKCPHCGKFPFEDEIQIYEIVRVVMFTAKGGGADEVSDEEKTHTKICYAIREGEDPEGVQGQGRQGQMDRRDMQGEQIRQANGETETKLQEDGVTTNDRV